MRERRRGGERLATDVYQAAAAAGERRRAMRPSVVQGGLGHLFIIIFWTLFLEKQESRKRAARLSAELSAGIWKPAVKARVVFAYFFHTDFYMNLTLKKDVW
jgi:hypothetical protein